MTHLETVAAQRDALAAKNRELAQQLEAANAEIARLKAAAASHLLVEVTTLGDADRRFVEAGPPPVTYTSPDFGVLSTGQPANRDGTPFDTPPKPKRARLFGGKP